MVCDPVTAFSVACNVLQVIELGVKALSKAAAYRRSETGGLKEQQDLRDVSQSLSELNTNLLASIIEDQTSNQPTVEHLRLVEANNRCLRLSKDLVDFLDTLKLKDKHAVFDSLRVSIKAMWHKERVEMMEKSISQARNNLLVAFLVYMKYNIDRWKRSDDLIFSSKQASKVAQDEIFANTTRVEGTILSAMASTSNLLQDDIKSLTERLSNISLEVVPKTVAQFAVAHHANFERLSEQLNSIFAFESQARANSDEVRTASARQPILDSLHFVQMYERRDHIAKAHHNTYRWILEQRPEDDRRWDNFISWLGASKCRNRIYRVTGKIGSGKTTLLRFLDDNIIVAEHMLPWANEASVVRGSFFFWNGGTILQKSITGLLRTLLIQMFQETPDLVSQVVPSVKWQTASLPEIHPMEWAVSELRDCLRDYISRAATSRKIFLLVDGLDELDGRDEERDGLIDLLVEFTAYENVKICLSSRPWNIFRDAFERCPQLKLEDLTRNDIEEYVRGQLYGNRRFCNLMQFDGSAAETFIMSLISKASGVFLWVRLVVKELLNGVRDGDGVVILKRKIEDIPADLDDYLLCIFESIEPRYRPEASTFLQLALYDEDEFISLHSNSLMDFSFIEEGRPDFALDPFYNFAAFDLADAGAMAFRLESTMRKINSCCRGLLEINMEAQAFDPMETFQSANSDTGSPSILFESTQDKHDSDTLHDENLPTDFDIFDMADWPVEFLHRSLRDFLLSPKIQAMLHHSTNGSYNARMFFQNARLVQLVALNRIGGGMKTMGLASYVLSSLSVASYRNTPGALTIATLAQPAIEKQCQQSMNPKDQNFWYIHRVTSNWKREESNFLTLAIDFRLESYVRAHLTAETIKSKKGRPILDLVLRPRFAVHFRDPDMSVGNQIPDLNLLKRVLDLGADPNQAYGHSSVCALFLCFLADHFHSVKADDTFVEETTYLEALQILVERGADIALPRRWLSGLGFSEAPRGNGRFAQTQRFSRRFPYAAPIAHGTTWDHDIYTVSSLLECYRHHFGASLDAIQAILLPLKAKEVPACWDRPVRKFCAGCPKLTILGPNPACGPKLNYAQTACSISAV